MTRFQSVIVQHCLPTSAVSPTLVSSASPTFLSSLVLVTPDPTHLQFFGRNRRSSRWPFGNYLGNRSCCIPWRAICVFACFQVPVTQTSLLLPSVLYLLFSATLSQHANRVRSSTRRSNLNSIMFHTHLHWFHPPRPMAPAFQGSPTHLIPFAGSQPFPTCSPVSRRSLFYC